LIDIFQLPAITALEDLTIRIIPAAGKVARLAIIPLHNLLSDPALEGFHTALVFKLSRMGGWL